MPDGDDPKGAGADPTQPVHEARTVVQGLDLDWKGARDADSDSPTGAGLAGLDDFATALLEIGLIDAAELASYSTESSEGVLGLSRALVKAGKLTPYQAAAVYQKKSRGLLIGNYLILDKLGQGGMGVVFKARHRRLGRVGALKILPPSFARDKDAVLRFRREVEAAGRLKHPNLVAAQDADEDRGVHFLVMDYVEGRDLDRIVAERGPLPIAQAIDCLIQAARGLEAAHAQGIVHRDIKPANLMLDTVGTVRVLDLGLARIVDASNPFGKTATGRLTQSDMYMGTVDYMAPEQAEDSHRVDHRADIYSLGCTFYYLLTGQEPFLGETVLKRLMAHMEKPAPSLRIARPEVPPSLDAAYLKMMAKRPGDRPASMAEVISLLEACKATTAEAPKSRPELKVFDEAPLKRAVPKTEAGTSIFARPKEPEDLLLGHELSLEDLVMDVRPAAPPTPLPPVPRPVAAKTQPLKRLSSTRSPSRSTWSGLVFIALAAAGVLGVVLVRFAIFREPTRNHASAPANAVTAPALPNPAERTAPEPASTDPIGTQPSGLKLTSSHPPTDLKNKQALGFPQHQAAVQSLFNGKDLAGWFVDSGVGNTWGVDNGDLLVTGTGDYRKLGWLLSERRFSDFILRFEFQFSKGVNSGVGLRAESGDRVENLPVHPEVSLYDTDKPGREETGTFHWSRSFRAEDWLPLDRRSQLRPVGSWNEMEIELRGQQLRVRINGSDVLTKNLRQLVALPDALPGIQRESGRVGFQAHTGTARFRNIWIEDLTATSAQPAERNDVVAGDAPKPIVSPSFFDGKTLTGWGGLQGYWSLRDGAIVGSPSQGRPAHTFLCSTRSYSNFELRFKARLKDGIGNSGVQFRSRITDQEKYIVVGPQCELGKLTAPYAPGSLVTEPTGTPAVAARREDVARVYKEDQFNDFLIQCVDKHVLIRVNGLTTVDSDFPSMPETGIIAWQLHGKDSPKEVTFTDVGLVELNDMPWYTVHVQAVQCCDDNGGRRCPISIPEMRAMIDLANAIYSKARVRLAWSPTSTTVLRNTVINSLMSPGMHAPKDERFPGAGTLEQESRELRKIVERYPGKMVVFFRWKDRNRNPTGNGYSGEDASCVVMPGLRVTNMGPIGFSRLVGLYFGLHHTFARRFASLEEASEFLKNHGGNTAVFDGDGLSDTPPDPGLDVAYDNGTRSVTLDGTEVPLPAGNVMSWISWPGHEWMSSLQAERVRQFYRFRSRYNMMYATNMSAPSPIEAESLPFETRGDLSAKPDRVGRFRSGSWSGDTQLYAHGRPGGSLIMKFAVTEPGPKDVNVYMTLAPDYGKVDFTVDGQRVGQTFDGFAPLAAASGPIPLGKHDLSRGEHTIAFTIVGKNDESKGTALGVDCLSLAAADR